ncbi:Alternative oxidase [Purpureocillium lavendulum]|uniref:Alternative oxidase n=1 Tax=Purpureocillium lavendulum TaxID=1247861 RepID=A0AB34FHR0_9HYPO|nr:Alternative oxidase [Purpureocillium lavendulum]
MTEDRLRILKSKIKQFKGSSDDVDLPSGYTFTKHLSAWEETLANHLPYIHVPTLRLNECIPELVLALAALGAQQRYETRASLLLYHTSKDIALERMRITRSRKGGASTVRSEQSGTVLQSACTLLTLLIFATWSADAKLVEEALELHSPLIFCLRDDGLGDDNEIPGQDWHSWAASETRIRIKLMAFCFLNLHTIAYDHPPALFWHEVNLRLPCTVEEWHAADPARWFQSLEQVTERQRCFPEALKQLLSMDGQAAQIQPAPSPFGNYVLLHGLIQRIHLIRQLTGPSALEEEDITKLHLLDIELEPSSGAHVTIKILAQSSQIFDFYNSEIVPPKMPTEGDLNHDCEFAQRGLVAAVDDPVVLSDSTKKVVWDTEAYNFLQEDCPDTANKMLWR